MVLRKIFEFRRSLKLTAEKEFEGNFNSQKKNQVNYNSPRIDKALCISQRCPFGHFIGRRDSKDLGFFESRVCPYLHRPHPCRVGVLVALLWRFPSLVLHGQHLQGLGCQQVSFAQARGFL